MKISLNTENKGITLLELIVYLGLFTILFTTIVTFVITVAQANHVAAKRKNLEKTFIFVNEHLNSTFTKVNTLDTENSAFENNNGVLRVLPATGYYEYSLLDGKLTFRDESGTVSDLTTEEFKVDQFYLERVNATVNGAVGVRMTLHMTSKNDEKINDTIETMYTFK